MRLTVQDSRSFAASDLSARSRASPYTRMPDLSWSAWQASGARSRLAPPLRDPSGEIEDTGQSEAPRCRKSFRAARMRSAEPEVKRRLRETGEMSVHVGVRGFAALPRSALVPWWPLLTVMVRMSVTSASP